MRSSFLSAMRKHMKFLFLFLFVGLLVVVYVRYVEYRSLFFPFREIAITPASAGLPFEDVAFTAADGTRLSAWFIPASEAAYTVLFFHGNGGNISHRIDKVDIFHGLGLNVCILDYRGYGKSSGKPSEAGLYVDAQAAYGYLVLSRKVRPERIVIYGESLGGAVAVDLASHKPAAALIVDSSFTSSADMAQALYPFVPSFLFASRFDSGRKITGVTVPKLFIHSANDEIVPFALGLRLFEKAPQPKEFLRILGSHNTNFLDSRQSYLSGLGNFIRKLGS
jgi:uncharacterized protein